MNFLFLNKVVRRGKEVFLSHPLLFAGGFFVLVIFLNFGSFSSFEDHIKIRGITITLWACVGLFLVFLLKVDKHGRLRILLAFPYLLSPAGFIGIIGFVYFFFGKFYFSYIVEYIREAFSIPLDVNLLLISGFAVSMGFAFVGIGVLRNKGWGYFLALCINGLIFVGSTIFHIKKVFCGKEMCVDAEEITYLGNSIAAILFLSSLFLWYFWKTQKMGSEIAKRQTRIWAVLMLITISLFIGFPSLQAYQQERGGSKQSQELIALARATLDPFYPTFLPEGWKLRWEVYVFEDELRSSYCAGRVHR